MKKKWNVIPVLALLLAVVMVMAYPANFAAVVDTDAVQTDATTDASTDATTTDAASTDAASTDAASTDAVSEDLVTEEVAAEPAPVGVEVALYLMESNENWSWGEIEASEWSEPSSESIFIDQDGTYTFALEGLDIPADMLMLCYLKDVAAYPSGSDVKTSNVPEDIMVITNEFMVNGTKLSVNDLVRTGLKKGLFDIAYRNNWDENDNCVMFNSTINSISITITVSGITGEPGAFEYVDPAAVVEEVVIAEDTVQAEPVVAAEVSEEGEFPVLAVSIGGGIVVLAAIVVVVVLMKKKRK